MTSLSAFCSLLGTLWIILGYLFTPELRKAPFYKLVVCLSVGQSRIQPQPLHLYRVPSMQWGSGRG